MLTNLQINEEVYWQTTNASKIHIHREKRTHLAHRQTDRQTDRYTDKQAGRQSESQNPKQ